MRVEVVVDLTDVRLDVITLDVVILIDIDMRGVDDIDVMGSLVIDKLNVSVVLDVIVEEISSDDTETDGVLAMVLEDDGEGSLSVVVVDDMTTIVDVEDDITIKLY